MTTQAVNSIRGAALAGTWQNTNPSPKLMRHVCLSQSADGFTVRVTGAGLAGSSEWGEAPARMFSEALNSLEGSAFTARFECDRFSSILQSYVVKGVLVIVSMTRFGDASGERSIFTKEFFYRTSP
jgi:hypothetical protein